MAMNRPPTSSRGGQRQLVLTIVGVLAVVVSLGILAVIVSSVSNSFSQSATQVAQIPTLAVINQSGSSAITANTQLPADTSTPAMTPTDLPTATPMPTATAAQVVEVLGVTPTPLVITATPPPLPPLPFQPLPGRSFYMSRLELNGPVQVVDLPLANQTWDVRSLGHYVGHLEATNWPDAQQGNVVLVAHIQLSTTDFGPFVYLNKTQIGDLIYLVDNGQVFTYQVTEITTVSPTDVTVTYPTAKPILTLITCTTWDQTHGVFAQRFVVRAKLVNGPAPIT